MGENGIEKWSGFASRDRHRARFGVDVFAERTADSTAIHEADSKHHPLMEATGKTLHQACADLGLLISLSPDVVAILREHKDAEFRRLLDKIEEAIAAEGEAHIELQYEHERIEDKFNKLTVEFFAKYPHPIITTVDQRIEARRENEKLIGQTDATDNAQSDALTLSEP